ncbi:MAG: hypothetical protein JWL71_1757 [Acidobacteria bacterium]|nr:hypothetical protein [Acidobacteriota bacterium]
MARPLRLHIPGALYHVMSRGNARQQIFVDDEDYEYFLHRLAVTSARFGARTVTYCLMKNHFHVLLESGPLPLSRMMQQLNSSYSQRFNVRHERVGHVLQGRFKAPIIDGDAYFLRVLRYIALNPVRSHLVAHPGDWPWSSYRALAGLAPPPPFLAADVVWDAFGVDRVRACERFAAFTAAGLTDGDEVPSRALVSGSDAFVARVATAAERYADEGEVIYAERFACRPGLDRLFADATDAAALDRSMRAAFEQYGYTLREIGGVIGRSPATVCKRIRRIAARGVPPSGEKIKI